MNVALSPLEAEVYDDLDDVFGGSARVDKLDDWFGGRDAWRDAAAELIRKRLVRLYGGVVRVRDDAGLGLVPRAAYSYPARAGQRQATRRRAAPKVVDTTLPAPRKLPLPEHRDARDPIIQKAVERGLTYVQAARWLGVTSTEVADAVERMNTRSLRALEARAALTGGAHG